MELEPWDIFLPLLFFISMSLSIHCFTLGITSDFWTPLYIYIIGLLISKFLDSNRPIGGVGIVSSCGVGYIYGVTVLLKYNLICMIIVGVYMIANYYCLGDSTIFYVYRICIIYTIALLTMENKL